MGAEVRHDPLGRRQGPSGILPGHGRSDRRRNSRRASTSTSSAIPANPLAHETAHRPGDLGADGRHDVDAVVCGVGSGGTLTGLGRFFAKVARRPRWCWPTRSARSSRDYVKTGRAEDRGRLLAGRGHRRGLRPADLRPVAGRQAYDHRRRRGELSTRRASCCAKKASSPARRRAPCSPRRCATAARRPSPSGSSPSSATAATSICPRCSTTTGWSTRACWTDKHGDLRDLISRAVRGGRHGDRRGRPTRC